MRKPFQALFLVFLIVLSQSETRPVSNSFQPVRSISLAGKSSARSMALAGSRALCSLVESVTCEIESLPLA